MCSEDIKLCGLEFLIKKYDNSLPTALETLFPGTQELPYSIADTKWNFWEFKCYPKKLWNSKTNQFKFLGFVKQQLQIKEYEDWYKVHCCHFVTEKGYYRGY